MATETVLTDRILESQTGRLTATITQEDGATGFKPDICTFTLYDERTGSVINSRTDVDILTVVSIAGALSLELLPADNPIVTAGRGLERHCALIEWTWSGGTRKGAHTIKFDVQSHSKI